MRIMRRHRKGGAVNDDHWTEYGFVWGAAEVERMASLPGGSRVIAVYTEVGNKRKRRLEIYVSPTGRSVRVWRDGKELR